MESKTITVLYSRLKALYLRAEELMTRKENAEALRTLLSEVNSTFADLLKEVGLSSELDNTQCIPHINCTLIDLNTAKREFDEHVGSWLKSLLSPSSPTEFCISLNKGPASNCSRSTSSSVRSEKQRSLVKLRLAAQAKKHEDERVHETRYRARMRAERAKERAAQAEREAELELQEIEEEAERSLREKKRDLELAQAEVNAWKEAENEEAEMVVDSLDAQLQLQNSIPLEDPVLDVDEARVDSAKLPLDKRPISAPERNIVESMPLHEVPMFPESRNVPNALSSSFHNFRHPVSDNLVNQTIRNFQPLSVNPALLQPPGQNQVLNKLPINEFSPKLPQPAQNLNERSPTRFPNAATAPVVSHPDNVKQDEPVFSGIPEIPRVTSANPGLVYSALEYCDRPLPRIEIKKFDGDPMNYWSFIRSFTAYVGKKCCSDDYRRQFFIQSLDAKVRERFEQFQTIGPTEGFQKAWAQLYEDYGHPHVISRSCEERLKATPKVKDFDSEGLNKLSILLNKCCTCLEHSPRYSTLDSMDVMLAVCKRLPNELRFEWVKTSVEIERRTGDRARFTDLTAFVNEQSRVLDSMFGKAIYMHGSPYSKPAPEKKSSKRERCMAAVPSSTKSYPSKNREGTEGVAGEPSLKNCACCSKAHLGGPSSCNVFKNMNYQERLNVVRANGLCFKCLKANHTARECRSTAKCSVENCTGTLHHSLLHRIKPAPSTSSNKVLNNEMKQPVTDSSTETTTSAAVQQEVFQTSSTNVYLNVVPVKVKYEDQEISTYAFLDQGSTSTFCEKSLADKLNVAGTPKIINIQTLTSPQTLNTFSFSLSVQALDGGGDVIHLTEVIAVDEIPVKPNAIPNKGIMKRHKYLKNVPLSKISDGTVQLLIGANVPEVFRVESSRRGPDGYPDLIRSPLGWSLFGPSFDFSPSDKLSCHFIAERHMEPANLEQAMFLKDESDLRPTTADGDIEYLDVIKTLSAEDRRTYALMKDSVKLVDGHYELPLPWRHDHQCLPNNRVMAEKRLKGLKKRLLNNKEMHQKYNEQMAVMIEKEYAEEIPTNELDTKNRIWYIPHHPVFNVHKPEKLRIVYDCAATYNGVSLNQVLMQGPDLVNSLVGVLTRFRKEKIAIIADIEAMFHQIRVAQRDRDSLRFLWWPNGDFTKQAVPHRMCVHLFGSVSSPSCASFCLRQTAEEFGSNFEPHVATTVERNFYVDDLLCSVSDSDDGIQLIEQLQSLLSKAGFRLTKWLSNSQRVIDAVPQEERSKSLKVASLDSHLHERVLGVNWDVVTDEFEFTTAMPMKPRTRRGMLSTMNSLFDPLGFVNPIILEARMIYRKLCQQELEWDEPVPEQELRRWEKWLSTLPQLQSVRIPRFIGLKFSNSERCQLHFFADASKHAYGAVCYLRTLDSYGNAHCVLMMAKSHLSPKAEESVPRLELMAAVSAVKMDQILRKELALQLRPSIFWSDSSIVIQSLQNDTKRFPLFVSRRLSLISKHTCVDNWKHVPTKQNPADFVSRGATADALVKSKLWFAGPEFLLQTPENWPGRFEKKMLSPEEIVQYDKRVDTSFVIQETAPPMSRLISYFSSWYQLRRAAAWFTRFKLYIMKYPDSGKNLVKVSSTLTVEELQQAGRDLIAYEQQQHFAPWMNALSSEKMLPASKDIKSSSLMKLDPVLIDGVMRVRGRLQKAPISFEAKHPIILPHVSHLTEMIIRHHHETTGHSGLNFTLNSLYQKFWIVRANSAVRRVINNCIFCRFRNSKPGEQLMAELPVSRFQIDSHPFAYTGIDYFGPLMIRQRRSDVKRYGCLFTCLSTRAVHLEVASDLTTDAFINAFRRFISRRGQVIHMYSDNGTNLVGGERELREAICNWNQHQIDTFFQQKEIQWSFNPPSASHMGGAWERMIKSVRRILIALTKDQTLSDDQLQTFLLEAEAILNARPLTPVTLNEAGETPLTPNHLLRVNATADLPPALTSREDCYARRRWRRVQYLADQFWKRWSREYLRSIIIRQKWLSKKRNFQVGDVVLLIDNNLPRAQWSIGRISSTLPDEHGVVRTVNVKSRGSQFLRPIHKLCLVLPVDDEVPRQQSDDASTRRCQCHKEEETDDPNEH